MGMVFGTKAILSQSLLILGALFPIVNPVGNAPIFLNLTEGYSSGTRELLARKIAFNCFVLIITSILIGTYILEFFGISLPVVQVGGGMVVIATGWSLLNQKDEAKKAEAMSLSDLSKRAFYPLTLPLTVGPGSISVAITLGANQTHPAKLSLALLISVLLGAVLLAVTIYASYRFSEGLARLLGETGMSIVLRLSSFILLCIGVQILWNGVSTLLATVR